MFFFASVVGEPAGFKLRCDLASQILIRFGCVTRLTDLQMGPWPLPAPVLLRVEVRCYILV